MSCLITAGSAKGCKDNMGGVKTVYIANRSQVTGFIPDLSTDTTGIITGITMSATSSVFYEFVPNKMSSSWVENIQSNIQNGTVAYEQVLTLMLGKNEASKRNQIKLLGQGEMIVIVEDRNSKYWLLGEENGVELTGGNGQSGTALTDMNGWSLTLASQEHDPAREVASTIIAALLVSR